jgi:S1-C subfamily serine protease
LQPHEQKPVIQNTLPLQQTSTKETYTALAASPEFCSSFSYHTPSVVYIKTLLQLMPSKISSISFWGQWKRAKSNRSGSGYFLPCDGYIVTNNHVIENATSIEVIHK